MASDPGPVPNTKQTLESMQSGQCFGTKGYAEIGMKAMLFTYQSWLRPLPRLSMSPVCPHSPLRLRSWFVVAPARQAQHVWSGDNRSMHTEHRSSTTQIRYTHCISDSVLGKVLLHQIPSWIVGVFLLMMNHFRPWVTGKFANKSEPEHRTKDVYLIGSRLPSFWSSWFQFRVIYTNSFEHFALAFEQSPSSYLGLIAVSKILRDKQTYTGDGFASKLLCW